MGRKRPPGAKRRGPTRGGPAFDLWGNDPRAVAYRLSRAEPLVVCAEEYHLDVMQATHEYLTTGEWHPPLGKYSLLARPAGDWASNDDDVLVLAFGLSAFARGGVVSHLERHGSAALWRLWEFDGALALMRRA